MAQSAVKQDFVLIQYLFELFFLFGIEMCLCFSHGSRCGFIILRIHDFCCMDLSTFATYIFVDINSGRPIHWIFPMSVVLHGDLHTKPGDRTVGEVHHQPKTSTNFSSQYYIIVTLEVSDYRFHAGNRETRIKFWEFNVIQINTSIHLLLTMNSLNVRPHNMWICSCV